MIAHKANDKLFIAVKEASMNSFQIFQSLTTDRTCCICGKKLTAISDFCDPTPLYSADNEFSCHECFCKYVVKARIVYINEEKELIYNISPKKDPVDPYLENESPEIGQIRLISYKGVVHHTPEKYTLSCTQEKIPSRGKAARSARIGDFSELNCPDCRKLLLRDIPVLATHFPADSGTIYST